MADSLVSEIMYVMLINGSGCVTSAESVLITEQSQEELYRVLQENEALVKVCYHELVLMFYQTTWKQSFLYCITINPSTYLNFIYKSEII